MDTIILQVGNFSVLAYFEGKQTNKVGNVTKAPKENSSQYIKINPKSICMY